MSLLLVGICLKAQLYASHIIGGELTYISLGNNQYEVTLTMYRDCNGSSSIFDSNYALHMYNETTGSTETLTMYDSEFTNIQYDALENNCLELPPGICIQQAIFTKIITINSPQNSHILYVTTCCRDEAVINLINPDDQGSTFTASIPATSTTTSNNSATFNAYPPLGICLGEELNVDLSASDIDGDSLSYELTTPYTESIIDPPFPYVNWTTGYSATYPVDASPSITINPTTGLITGTPIQMGMYILAVKVSEFNNGTLINELIRDFRFLVVDCELTTASFPESGWFCSSLTANFTNQSQDADNYLWTFGDPTNPNYSTTDISPSYTFPDTGIYTVTLIANPGDICADTLITEFPVYDEISANFTTESIPCSNDLNFIPTGQYPLGTNFLWDFGIGSTPSNSVNEYPPSISYNSAGQHDVELFISFNTCDSTTINSIESIEPVIDPIISSEDSLCLEGNIFNFEAQGVYPNNVSFDWYFGNNANITTSQEQNPENISFTTGGSHPVTLTINYNDCTYTTYDTIYVHPFININFTANIVEGCEPLLVDFTPNIISNTYLYNWSYDSSTSNINSPTHTFMNGYYDVELQITDSISGCIYNSNVQNYIHSKPQANTEFEILSPSPQCFNGNLFNFTALHEFNPQSTPLWNFGLNAEPQFNSAQNPNSITYNSGGMKYIQLNIELNGCNSTFFDSVYVHPEEFPEIYSTSPIDCEPLTIHFSTNLEPDNYEYFWNLSEITSISPTPNFTYMAGDYDISVDLINLTTSCPLHILEQNYVHVEPQPEAGFTAESYSFLYGDEVWVENHAEHSTNYLYDFGTGYTSTEENPSYVFPALWNYEITQYAMNDIGCIDSSTVEVFIDYQYTFYLPNTFSPNNDNINDLFFAKSYKVDYYEMKIFDCWGKMVFSDKGKQPTWNGKLSTKEDAQQGTYNYYINFHTIEEGWKKTTGLVVLIR